MLRGIPPYRFAYNMKLPGTYAAYAAIMSVFGQTARGIHLGLLAVNLATVVLLYLLARRLFDERTGAMAAACYALLSLGQGVFGVLARHALRRPAGPGGNPAPGAPDRCRRRAAAPAAMARAARQWRPFRRGLRHEAARHLLRPVRRRLARVGADPPKGSPASRRRTVRRLPAGGLHPLRTDLRSPGCGRRVQGLLVLDFRLREGVCVRSLAVGRRDYLRAGDPRDVSA